jgi:hydrogenase maturation protein HypF
MEYFMSVMSESKRERITVEGVVQGVGFRPFVFNLAVSCSLAGHVCNNSGGVLIEVQGPEDRLLQFKKRLEEEAPAQSHIDLVTTEDIPPQESREFRILLSRDGKGQSTLIPPDLAVCPDCLRELFNPRDRRYQYPFLNCTNCGPRFTIIRRIPYDRPETTMADFVMCPECSREYHDPADRRFHAQPTACPVCGPRLQLLDNDYQPIAASDPVAETVQLLKAGKILALKGLGGFHLAVSALDEQAVNELRRRKRRIQKPFAIMVESLEAAGEICHVSEEESRLLKSVASPIVLLKKKEDCPVAQAVAPRLNELGVMLPYTPLHHLIMHQGKIPLVMTSANLSEEPIAYRENADRCTLAQLADTLLVHNRAIHSRCDDSVTRVWQGRPRLIRRSRGYSPLPLTLSKPASQPVLACGAMLKNTFCLGRDRDYLLSHHIGDLENLETMESFEEGIRHFENLFRCRPERIACDLHPDYLSTRYAESRAGEKVIKVQHHKAHIYSCMADNNFFEPVIGVAWDGLGYGEDGLIWGGEFFTGDITGLERKAHIRNVPQPGGDVATREPWRMALAWLSASLGQSWNKSHPELLEKWADRPVDVVQTMIRQNLNTVLTSSAGRLFDAVSALVLGIEVVTYEGEAAIALEAAARKIKSRLDNPLPLSIIPSESGWVLDPAPVFEILSDRKTPVTSQQEETAFRFHLGLACSIRQVCEKLRQESGIRHVALSGGVFQNTLLLDLSLAQLKSAGFQVLTHSRVPANDGGIALGQAVYAGSL